jgi:lipopolysaccharide/colanic/teichoic acid biosynthesis glycosyltransferase
LAVKRAVDVVGSLALLVVLSPLLALIYVAVRATSPGRGVFAQRRIGLNGRVFVMYKFRSMVRDAEAMLPALRPLNEMTGPAFKIACDPRVTWVGRRLRRFSLDELPQFWNVLRGDMSLVGPRPPLADEVIEYERWQRRRLSMRPGMTGLWQIRGRHRVGFDEWMRCDLEYIDRWSLWLDIRILVKTLLVVLRGEGV